ncbi:MAG TPA: AAA family ATPase [Solirubrobacterales bacterium]|nr:AAA family ATPase [Solirubrobacterales bacterium]
MSTAAIELPDSLAETTADQASARVALAGALKAPSHAYLFSGPAGSGKRAAARAFAGELLALGAPDPESARRRAAADPSPHPDLAWLRPPGAQHLVDDVRTRIIEAAPYRPFEGEHRVFVVEEADAMAEESQNALLKTLEEPAPFAHILLVSSQPSALLETVRSRCQVIAFAALSPEALEERLAGTGDPAEVRSAARLAGGDVALAGLLLTETGRELRAHAEAFARAACAGELDSAPWSGLLDAAEKRGIEAGEEVKDRFDALADQAKDASDRRGEQRIRKEGTDAGKRATRRGRNNALDTGLALVASWLRDLAAVGDGAGGVVLNTDRESALSEDADEVEPRRARRAAELVMDTRRRLSVNVSEELAVEALAFRLEAVLRGA